MNKKSGIINGIIVGASVVVLIGYIVFVDGLDKILNAFSNCKPIWLLVGVLVMVGYWLSLIHI